MLSKRKKFFIRYKAEAFVSAISFCYDFAERARSGIHPFYGWCNFVATFDDSLGYDVNRSADDRVVC
jgi:hypothetical protein